MIRVLLAEDEPLVAAGVRTILQSTTDIEVPVVVGDGRAAVNEVRSRRVDVLLIDVNMPTLDGLSALEELRRAECAPPTVMLTSFGEEPNVLRALENGASGFVLKNCSPQELIDAVRAAHAGEGYLSPAVTRLVMGMVTPEQARERRAAAERTATLAPREAQVADLVAAGMSNADIAVEVHMSEASVKTYVSRILAKLGCANRVQAALLVRDAGSRAVD